MAYVLADNIISPLGETSEENYLAVKAGKSGIRAYAKGSHGIPDGFVASLMSLDFEELVINSAKEGYWSFSRRRSSRKGGIDSKLYQGSY